MNMNIDNFFYRKWDEMHGNEQLSCFNAYKEGRWRIKWTLNRLRKWRAEGFGLDFDKIPFNSNSHADPQ